MSDSEDSTISYTAVSSPFGGLSDIRSPGVDGPPVMPEDPYAYVVAAFLAPPSPDYVSGPKYPHLPEFVTETSPGYIDESDPEDDPKEDPEEDPADYPADGGYEGDNEDELCTAHTGTYELGESSVTVAVRHREPVRGDLYRFVDTVEQGEGSTPAAIEETAPTTVDGVNQRVTELSTTFDRETSMIYAMIEEKHDDQGPSQQVYNTPDIC
nr:hypothetical protein [Tanacetum cinerariifolium]